MKLGYKRVSTVDQNESRQLDGLVLDKVYIDKCSGKSTERPALKELMEFARKDDEIFIHSFDRLARNQVDLKEIISFFVEKDIKVHFVRGGTFEKGQSTFSNIIINFTGFVSEMEQALIHERIREGQILAKKAGKYKGRKPILNQTLKEGINWLLECGSSKSEICRNCNISRPTLYRYIRSLKPKGGNDASANTLQ